MEFLTGKPLAEEIYDTIYYAEKYILILSPFIQLDEYFKEEVFKTHLNNSQVHIILGFGKNESNISRSFKKQDIEYFTQFPNITIVYIPNLHGKYYGNEKKGIITSMNLIDFSFLNNIEFGVSADKKLVGNNKFFDISQGKCFNILEEDGFTIYVKRPKYKKKRFFGKDYVGSEIEFNVIDNIASGQSIEQIRVSEFLDEKYVNASIKETRIERAIMTEVEYVEHFISSEEKNRGHCIRCKTSIAVDLEKPLCWSCYKIWAHHGNPNHEENYCISCGDDHKTTIVKPACYSCYKKIK
ncbi:phospholipase D-like domain-containing protein [uncultured Algibacter sp.]|uniref:phospholipase D-like domain-containing protein n=1 Tax=uncultured Algibacter sp. TaxID=298659 RepID=UPI003217E70B